MASLPPRPLAILVRQGEYDHQGTNALQPFVFGKLRAVQDGLPLVQYAIVYARTAHPNYQAPEHRCCDCCRWRESCLDDLRPPSQHPPELHWLSFFPFSEVGGTLLVAAILGLGLDYFTNKDNEAHDTERLRRVLAESAPAMRDTVIDGFAFDHGDLARVSNPETLDNVIRNSLALRLGDRQFADEVYGDIRDQAVKAPERRHDARVSVQLSPYSPSTQPAHAAGNSSTRRSKTPSTAADHALGDP